MFRRIFRPRICFPIITYKMSNYIDIIPPLIINGYSKTIVILNIKIGG